MGKGAEAGGVTQWGAHAAIGTGGVVELLYGVFI